MSGKDARGSFGKTKRYFKLYAVVGKPILHSLSPEMFRAAFADREMDAEYVRLASTDCESAVRTLEDMGADGFNATSPYKEELVQLMERLDRTVEETGAVNAVVRKGGQWVGHNTDVAGVSKALSNSNVKVRGEKAVVLGTGGAARAAIVALLADGASVTVAGRDSPKALELSREFGCERASLTDAGLGKALSGRSLVVGCLATGKRVVKPGLLNPGIAVLDANYRTETTLVKDARSRGCSIIDGREWLVQQGAESFNIFTSRDAPVDAMRRAAFSGEVARLRANRVVKPSIILAGFMASGKTSTGRALARRLGRGFADTDAMVEKAAGSAIPEIFKFGGEMGFRAMERGAIKDASVMPGRGAALNIGLVVAVGGGAVLDPRNVELLKGMGPVVLLWIDEATATERESGAGKRPLLKGRAKVSSIRKILAERERAYFKSSDLVVDSRGAVKDVAGVIADEVR